MAQVSGQSCGQATRTVSLMTSFYVEQLDPMAHRRPRAVLQVIQAADVRGGNDIRAAGLERLELAAAQLGRDLRMQERIGAGRAATQMRVLHRRKRVTSPREERLDPVAQLLAVLQRAGRLECDRAAGVDGGNHLRG